jgi:hypothetical protein
LSSFPVFTYAPRGFSPKIAGDATPPSDRASTLAPLAYNAAMRRWECVAGAFVLAVACGGGRNPASAPEPVAAQPTPAPTPTPASTPAPSPTPTPCDECEAPVTNTNPVARLTLRVYFVEDGEGNVTTLGVQDVIPLGYLIHIDAVPKDAEGRETLGRGDAVRFSFGGDTDSVTIGGNHPFQRKLRVLDQGVVTAEGQLERVRSNNLRLKLVVEPKE